MVFRVGESFLTQKQSCITQKVGLEKWCLFFDFVCFSGRHFTQLHFGKKKQRCIPQKVGIQKWCLFFDFVCLSGCHFTKGGLFQKLVGKLSFLFQISFIYIVIIHISKVFCQFIFFSLFPEFFLTVYLLESFLNLFETFRMYQNLLKFF